MICKCGRSELFLRYNRCSICFESWRNKNNPEPNAGKPDTRRRHYKTKKSPEILDLRAKARRQKSGGRKLALITTNPRAEYKHNWYQRRKAAVNG